MSRLNSLFRKKIGFPEDQKITFETLNTILEKTATAFPFENVAIISNEIKEVTKENLIQKILVNHRGGLCYELNPLLYFFLIENGFDAVLVRGEVYNDEKKDWFHLERTHLAILLQHKGQSYLIDTGFGDSLPLMPVPLTGETAASRNGEFRVKAMENTYGNYVLEVKLKYKDTEWKLGYAFDSKRPLDHMSELNDVQEVIVEHDESPFNKKVLITQLTNDGNVTLTNTSFTQWINGKTKKEQIDDTKFKQLAEQYFGFSDL